MGRQTAKQKREDMSDRTRATRVAVLYKVAFTPKQGGTNPYTGNMFQKKGIRSAKDPCWKVPSQSELHAGGQCVWSRLRLGRGKESSQGACIT